MHAIEKLFADLPRIPSMPRVVQDLIASLVKEDIDIGSLVAQVKFDQSLSARVLAMANSSAFGASRRVGAIDQAVAMIGLAALRSLVIASGISRAFAGVEGIDLPAFWRESMICAGVARELGKNQGVNREFAYTAGLMHRLGLILIYQAWPAMAGRISGAGVSPDRVQLEQERALFGLDHCEVGAELALRWNFPDTIQNALRWCVEPLVPEARPLAGIVNLAGAVTQGLLEGDDPEKISVLLDLTVLNRFSFSRVEVQKRIEACIELPASDETLL